MKMKKLTALALTATMAASLAACGQNSSKGETDTSAANSETAVSETAESTENKSDNTTGNEDVPTIKYATFTAYETIQGDGEKEVEKAINDYLDSKGYKFHIDLEITSGSDYTTLMDMNLASGTDIDIFLDMNYNAHAAQGSLLNLDSYLENELSGAAELFDQQWLDATKINGVHYAIPAHTAYSSTLYYVCRKDLVEEMGYDTSKVKDLNSLEEFFAAIKEKYPDMFCTDTIAGNPFTIEASMENFGYFNYLYGVGMSSDGSGKMVNMYDTDMFKEAAETATRWYKNGYLNPAGSTDTTYSPDYISSGQAFGWIVGNANDTETQAANYSNISGQPLMAIPLCDIPDSTAGFQWAIAQSCKHPSEAAQLLNLTYTDEYILNTICYGIEGTDYVWKEEANAYGYPEGTDRTTVPYSYAVGITVVGDRLKAYAFENYYSENDRAYIEKKLKGTPRTALFGMNLDATDLTTQIAAVTNVVNQYYNGLMCGELDADTYLPQFISALEGAGVNDIVEEAQRQYDAWQEENK